MAADEPRKASEILLDLESKVDSILQVVKLYDTNIKLILGKVNTTHSLLNQFINQSSLSEEQKQVLQHGANPFKHPELTSVSVGAPIEAASEILGQRRTDRNSSVSNITQPSKPIEPTASQPSLQTNSEKRVPVVQRIQRNGKDLYMASVEIFGQDGKLVQKVRSNAAGRWQSLLQPGKYLVKISKVDQSTKKSMESTQEIIIANTATGPITLPNYTFPG